MEKRSEPRKRPEEYHSAELSVEGVSLPYQFRIWNLASRSMAVLVKDNSEILPFLKVGDTIRAKFYSTDSPYPSGFRRTVIRHITKNEEGRLKGHVLVGLEIVEDGE
ncbi:MAG: hypothetical protein JW821_18680 [Deltaproteobacteria bacterium]|nr:hypothetical protein [Deltaproteobacteria bacterium]